MSHVALWGGCHESCGESDLELDVCASRDGTTILGVPKYSCSGQAQGQSGASPRKTRVGKVSGSTQRGFD